VLEKTCASSEVDLLDFSVERWMSVDLDDGDLVREVAAPQLTPAYHKLSGRLAERREIQFSIFSLFRLVARALNERG